MYFNNFQPSFPELEIIMQKRAANAVRGRAMTLALTCSKCNVYFRVGAWNKDITKFANVIEPAIPIGTKGKVDNIVYEVMGFVVKQEMKYKYSWREYLLFNPYKGYAFLSEYDGHWNFIWPIEYYESKNYSTLGLATRIGFKYIPFIIK